MSSRSSRLASALLDAHVAFLCEQLVGPGLPNLIEQELDAGLAAADGLTLDAVMDRQHIKDTIRVFAVGMELGAGIPELVGDIARALYAHELHDRTRLSQVIPDKVFDEVVDKALELKALREAIVVAVTTSPQYQAFASELIELGIKAYLEGGSLARGIPGARSMLKLGKAVVSATPGLEGSLDASLKKTVRSSVKALGKLSERALRHAFDDDTLRAAARDLWDQAKTTRVATLRKLVRSRDVEDAFVIGYEFWRELRRTEIYGALIEAGVDSFFDKYGKATLVELLQEIGVTRELMLGEALRYGPPVLKVLHRRKLLEPAVRRNLARFYDSAAAAAVLDKI
jgi:hypothetical protein